MLVFVLNLSLLSALSAAPLKIMPLGDSITLGVGGGGYRDPLGSSLAGSGRAWDYVGPLWAAGNHAGYNGWTIKQISAVSHAAISDHQPDIIMLMAGTNDFFFYNTDPKDPAHGCNATVAVKRMRTLLDNIFKAKPDTKILLSGVTHINVTRCNTYPSAPWHPPACPPDMQSNIGAFNKMLPTLVQSYTERLMNISFHDPNERIHLEAADYFTWGIHFSASGYKKIAAEWLRVLKPLLAN